MSRADYAHWNEEADRIWWQEEGRHEPQSGFDIDPRHSDALDAFCEEVSEWSDETIRDHLADRDYCTEWPKAAQLLREILADRG